MPLKFVPYLTRIRILIKDNILENRCARIERIYASANRTRVIYTRPRPRIGFNVERAFSPNASAARVSPAPRGIAAPFL